MTAKARRERFETDSNWTYQERAPYLREETLWFKDLKFIRISVLETSHDWEKELEAKRKQEFYKKAWTVKAIYLVDDNGLRQVSKTEALDAMKKVDK